MVIPKMITLYCQISLISPNCQFQLRFHIIPRNETLSKRFIKKFHELTNNSYEIRTKWITKKVKQLFKLKSRNPFPSCVIYQGVCVCEQTYINETRLELPREERENTSKDSTSAKQNIMQNCDGKNKKIPPKILNLQNT